MWNVFLKELLEILRDKRTLAFMLLMPAIIVPALFSGYAKLASDKAQQEGTRELRYALVADDGAPILQAVLAATPRLRAVPLGSQQAAIAAIQAEQIDFALIFAANGERAILAGQQPEISLAYNTATVFDGVGKRIKPLLAAAYTNRLRVERLAIAGVTPDLAATLNSPFKLSVASTASARQEHGEQIGALIPYLLFIMGLMSSIAVAIDMGAGEKERGTLESLLLLPISRSTLVIAKFLVVLCAAVISGAIGIASMGFCAMYMLGQQSSELQSLTQYIQVPELLMLGLLILPAYAMVAALLLSISFFARSHKEAASYAQQMTLIVFLPIMAAMLPGMKLSDGWSLVPITNTALAIKEVIKGTIVLTDLISVFLSTSVVAIVLLLMCIQWCKREAVLFRS
ncbi:ABC transporter permease [Pseudoduganella sp. FT93W]|uniref:ABC transporter permease n=1 Tax=Duganella fentianensis TaxID=2692177 RepID=A0A845I027_9BURK|nr:ABC transporter permease [Duganella fentianensis]MYN46633.1 ABC transporter permease [Duganella fentianensis]